MYTGRGLTKEKFSPRPHADSHTFRHIRTMTHMTVRTDTLILLARAGKYNKKFKLLTKINVKQAFAEIK